MAPESIEGRFSAHEATDEERFIAVNATLTRHDTAIEKLDTLIKPPWWKPWALIVGFIGLIVAFALTLGSTPSRAEFEARKGVTDNEIAKIWKHTGDLGNQTARTETNILNIQEVLRRLDSKMDSLLTRQK